MSNKLFLFIVLISFVLIFHFFSDSSSYEIENEQVQKEDEIFEKEAIDKYDYSEIKFALENFDKVRSMINFPIKISFVDDFLYKTRFGIRKEKDSYNLKENSNKTLLSEMFVVKEPLFQDSSKDNCVSFQPISLPDFYLYVSADKLISLTYSDDDEYKKNSTFCIKKYNGDTNEFQDYLFISSYADESKFLTHNLQLGMFNDYSTYFKSVKEKKSMAYRMISLDKVEEKFLPKEFLTRKKDSYVATFSYNGEAKKYEEVHKIIDDGKYFQPILIYAVRVETNGQLSEKQIKDSNLKVKKEGLYLTTSTKESYLDEFIMMPSIFPVEQKNRVCVSFSSRKNNNMFLSTEDRKLTLSSYRNSDDFKKNASFCLEKFGENYFRLESVALKDHYLNHHTLGDTYFYTIKDNITNKTKSAFQFTLKKGSKNNERFSIDFNDEKIQYRFSKKKKKFVRKNSIKNSSEIDIVVNSSIRLPNLGDISCEFYNEKYKIYYKSFKNILNERFIFKIDHEDQKYLDELYCEQKKNKKPSLAFHCKKPDSAIHLDRDCTLVKKASDKEITYDRGSWDEEDFDFEEYYSITTTRVLTENDKTVMINLVSRKERFSSEVESCFLLFDGRRYDKTSSVAMGRKLVLSFSLPKEDVGNRAEFECVVNPQQRRVGGVFNCQVDVKSKKIIYIDECQV